MKSSILYKMTSHLVTSRNIKKKMNNLKFSQGAGTMLCLLQIFVKWARMDGFILTTSFVLSNISSAGLQNKKNAASHLSPDTQSWLACFCLFVFLFCLMFVFETKQHAYIIIERERERTKETGVGSWTVFNVFFFLPSIIAPVKKFTISKKKFLNSFFFCCCWVM